MNILQINTADTKGGAGKVAYQLKNILKERGHQSSLLVSRKYSNDKDVKLIRPDYNLRRRILKKLTYYLANDLDLFSSGHILKMPEFLNADIVHCHNLHTNYFNLATLIQIAAIKPVVWTFHDMWPITAHCAHTFDGSTGSPQAGKIKESGFFTCPSLDIPPAIAWHNEKYLEKRKSKIYKNSNFHIVTPSKWLAGKVKQSVLKDKPLSVIYNGIDTKIFNLMRSDLIRLRLDLGLPTNKRIILIVAKRGQYNPWKGGNYAQETIMAFMDDSRAFFVDLGGDSNEANSNIKTVSYISNPAMLAKYYSAADILLYPSIADNCPLVVLEAMACGLPIVSFNTGGIPELIEHKINGYIAGYKNSNDLKAGLNYILDLSPQEIEKTKQYSINKIRTGFTSEKMADQYIELYKSLL